MILIFISLALAETLIAKKEKLEEQRQKAKLMGEISIFMFMASSTILGCMFFLIFVILVLSCCCVSCTTLCCVATLAVANKKEEKEEKKIKHV